MIKSRFILLIVSIVLLSCNNKELESKINSLEIENKELRDSIKKYNYYRILSSEMIILPSKNTEKIKFDGMLYNRLNNVPFTLYQLDTLHYTKGVKRREIFRNHSSPQFQIEVHRSLIKNKTLYLLAEYNIDSIKIQVPGILYLN